MKSKIITIIIGIILCMSVCISAAAADSLPAFPGAEGGGKYTKGARASSSPTVYHVTNLNASGSGSFKDAVSKSNRIIVFDVGGTIYIDGTLNIKKSNLTILGQTAPGDGITIAGGDLLLENKVQQIIMRHIRVRPTDKNGGEPDGLGGRWNKNIIVDHCSISWGVDEGLTIYAGSSESGTQGSNITVQNSISSESLRMSNHFKGAHGYGAIFGATNSSWHHNLLAHHDSRSPRLDRELKKTDIRNNVIYDWGQTNSAYGAEPYSYNAKTYNPSYVNWVNNYYKYGPSTKTDIRSRIFDVSNSHPDRSKSQLYFSGNYVFGDQAVTANNALGVNGSGLAELLSEPISMSSYEIPDQTAEDAYRSVLSDAGATLPKRDAIDARVVNDVKNQTGRIINRADEVGGIIKTTAQKRVFSIPQDWKDQNGMGSANEADIVPNGTWAGYTWIEAYVNDWTEQQASPSNPIVTVKSPAIQSMDTVGGAGWTVTHDGTVSYNAAAEPENDGDPAVTKIEIYDGAKLIKTLSASSVDEQLSLTSGTHWLSCRAYNERDEATQSPTSIVYSVPDNRLSGFTHTQIGKTPYDGHGGAWQQSDSITIMGSGSIARSNNGTEISGLASDSCDFVYKTISGDFDITVKMESMPKVDNGSSAGIMVRASLDPDSPMIMLADGWLKYGENVRTIVRKDKGAVSEAGWFSNISNNENYDTDKYPMPNYMRIQRSGDQFTFSVSNGGSNWSDNDRKPVKITMINMPDILYVGLAADSSLPAKVDPAMEYMAEATFSSLSIIGNEVTVTPSPIPDPTAEPTEAPTEAPTETPTPTGIYYKTKPELSGDTVTAEIINTTNRKSCFAIAVYDESGTILTHTRLVISGPTLNTTPIRMTQISGAVIRAYLWDENFSPAAEPVELK